MLKARLTRFNDIETIETELMLADLESIDKRMANVARKAKSGDKDAVEQEALLKAAHAVCQKANPRVWSKLPMTR